VIGGNTSPAAMMIGVRPTNCSLPGVRRSPGRSSAKYEAYHLTGSNEDMR
jgi:hypothetical protein